MILSSFTTRTPALQLAASLLLGTLVAAGVTSAPTVNPRGEWSTPAESFRTRVVATGFSSPWEVAWGPDGFLWITERVGKRVVRVNPADGSRSVAVTIDEVYQRVGQDGLLGMAFDPGPRGGRSDVYVMYTYDADAGPGERRRAKVRRYTFNPATQRLEHPRDVVANLPHGDDHGGGRLAIGRDGALYLSRGDHGANFLANRCLANRAQQLPTAADVRTRTWEAYQGKILRVNPDGSIPADNPVIAGVRSHVFSYGHRNPQGLAVTADGRILATEHGQDTDDEINLIEAGRNYGWPLIAGFQDNQYYAYTNWSASSPAPCASLAYGRDVPASVPTITESAVQLPNLVAPLRTFFTVPSAYDRRRLGNATAAVTGADIYDETAIPGWRSSLLVTSLMSGVVFRMPLSSDPEMVGPPQTYFRSTNRYRDLAVAPDGRRIYVITDNEGRTLADDRTVTASLQNPGALLEFTYAGPRALPAR